MKSTRKIEIKKIVRRSGKIRRRNRLISNVLMITILAGITAFVVDLARFPEVYATTWKYQLLNNVRAGDAEAVTYYYDNYISRNRSLTNYPLNIKTVTADSVTENTVIVKVKEKDGTIRRTTFEKSDFNITPTVGKMLDYIEVKGYIDGTLDSWDYRTKEPIKLYQFKADDDSVWWLLTEEEIGKIPEVGEHCLLTYFDNGTTAENKTCNCPPELYCECELYDDLLLNVKF